MKVVDTDTGFIFSGNVKSVDHSKLIKECLISKSGYRFLVFKFDSISVTSRVLSILTSYQKEHKNLKIVIDSQSLYELFLDLNLVKCLNVRKVNKKH